MSQGTQVSADSSEVRRTRNDGLIAIASYPKSGNTYMRLLLQAYMRGRVDLNELSMMMPGDSSKYYYQQAIPIEVTNVQPQTVPQLRYAAMLHCLASQAWTNYKFVKSHWMRGLGNQTFFDPTVFSAVIYLYRNPFEVVGSFAKHQSIDIDTAIHRMVSQGIIGRVTDEGIMPSFMGSYGDNVISHFKAGDHVPTIAISYKKLKENPAMVLGKVIEFIENPHGMVSIEEAVDMVRLDKMQKMEDENGFPEARGGRFFTNGTTCKLSRSQRKTLEAHVNLLPQDIRDKVLNG